MEPTNPSSPCSVDTTSSIGAETIEWTGDRVQKIIQTAVQPLWTELGDIKRDVGRILNLLEQGVRQTGLRQETGLTQEMGLRQQTGLTQEMGLRQQTGLSQETFPFGFKRLEDFASRPDVSEPKTLIPDEVCQDSAPGREVNREDEVEQTFVKVVVGDFVQSHDEDEKHQTKVKTLASDPRQSRFRNDQEQTSVKVVADNATQSQPVDGDKQTVKIPVGDSSVRGKSEGKEPDLDLGGQLEWFRKQVDQLQREVHTVEKRQEQILSTVITHCDFTQGVLLGRPRQMTESVSGSYMEPSRDERTQEIVATALQETKEEMARKAAEASQEIIMQTFDKLEALIIGQSLRVIENLRNPSINPEAVFHFYIPGFQEHIGSGRDVHGPTWVLDLMESFLVVRAVARFSADNAYDSMTIHLEQTMDMLEHGRCQGDLSQCVVTAKIRSDGSQARPDMELGVLRLQPESNPLRARATAVDCQVLVDDGYNNFRSQSVLIEIKVFTKGGPRSVYAALMGKMVSNFFRL